MTDIESLWDNVAKRSPSPRRFLMPQLRIFLLEQDNPHARLLSGLAPGKEPDSESAELLEALIIAQYREKKLSKLDTTDWLRMVYDALGELGRKGVDAFPTRLADIQPPESSPFSPAAMLIRRRVELWKNALHAWIETAGAQTSRAEWQVAIALSATLHGALLDTTKINGLIERLRRREVFSIASDYSHLDFDLPFQGLGNHHLQRWFPDPLTEMLIWRLPAKGDDLQTGSMRKPINLLLKTHGVRTEDCPSGLADFVQATATWWSERTAQIDVHSVRRTFTTHSIHVRTWSRLNAGTYAGRNVTRTRRTTDEVMESDESVLLDLPLLHPWLGEIANILDEATSESASKQIAELLLRQAAGSLIAVYVGWLDFMLSGQSSTRKSLSLSTIRRLFLVTTPRLLLMLGEDNPIALGTEELEDCYSEMVNERDPCAPIRDIATGLREFHAYLVRRHNKKHLKSLSEILGDDVRLLPVDANLVSFDDYLAAQSWLDGQLAEGRDADDVGICKLIMAMAFRLGMRRMEILGLRLQDIHLTRGMVCLIRPHQERRLKTKNSRRLLPLHPFLDWRERKQLKQWLARRRREEERKSLSHGAVHSCYVFAKVDDGIHRVSVEGVVDRVCEALRAVTGDGRIFLHHLRHAFGTWTYLRLRAPDYPMLVDFFSHLPETKRALQTGWRLRRLLMGRVASPSRIHAYAVARLLGHSGPAVSMGHYIHGSDLILATLVHREMAKVPRKVLIAASGLASASAYVHLQNSDHRLAVAIRDRFCQPPNIPGEKEGTTLTKNPVGRPRKTPAHLGKEWLQFGKVRSALVLFGIDEPSIESIATQLKLQSEQVESILCHAWRLGPLVGLSGNAEQLIPYPDKPRYAGEVALLEELEKKLAVMACRTPKLYLQGLDLHLKHLNRQKHDVVFKGAKDAGAARRYLEFLASLGMDNIRFQCVVRRPAADGTTLPEWTANIDRVQLPATVKRIGPPTATKTSSYAQWLGIKIIDDTGHGLGKAMATAMFLARVSYR